MIRKINAVCQRIVTLCLLSLAFGWVWGWGCFAAWQWLHRRGVL